MMTIPRFGGGSVRGGMFEVHLIRCLVGVCTEFRVFYSNILVHLGCMGFTPSVVHLSLFSLR